ncbi:MAG: HEPN domain-containing protein [Bacteroidales bacterium]|nr:HEPN domain-containing protein [Bacteroidales bacterium]
MNKLDHIQYWLISAGKDWEVVQDLFRSSQYIYALFFSHLTLEKLLKGHWVKDNDGNYPPRTHSLVRIAEGISYQIDEDTLAFLEKMNDFQLEGRYPDYQFKINQACTKEFTEQVLDKVNSIRICLLGILQSA